jgi:hypothetical protein
MSNQRFAQSKHASHPPFKLYCTTLSSVSAGLTEATRVNQITNRLSAAAFPNAAMLAQPANLGRLDVLMSKSMAAAVVGMR